MLTVGTEYTRAEIHAQCGGNQQTYLPHKAGVVVAACLDPTLNPGGNPSLHRCRCQSIAENRHARTLPIYGAPYSTRY